MATCPTCLGPLTENHRCPTQLFKRIVSALWIVGAGGVGGAVASGIKNGFAQAVVAGAVNNALVQGIGHATGLQDKFSWAGVAAAGVSAGAFHVASAHLPGEAHTTHTLSLRPRR